jgi:hypothetical protein
MTKHQADRSKKDLLFGPFLGTIEYVIGKDYHIFDRETRKKAISMSFMPHHFESEKQHTRCSSQLVQSPSLLARARLDHGHHPDLLPSPNCSYTIYKVYTFGSRRNTRGVRIPPLFCPSRASPLVWPRTCA